MSTKNNQQVVKDANGCSWDEDCQFANKIGLSSGGGDTVSSKEIESLLSALENQDEPIASLKEDHDLGEVLELLELCGGNPLSPKEIEAILFALERD